MPASASRGRVVEPPKDSSEPVVARNVASESVLVQQFINKHSSGNQNVAGEGESVPIPSESKKAHAPGETKQESEEKGEYQEVQI